MHRQPSALARRIGLGIPIASVVFGLLDLPLVYGSAQEKPDELAAHVRYLSQPKLKGRKTRTTGTRLTRQYIETRFRANGLVPWEGAKDYKLSFGLGINLVGVIPGSDPKVAD